MYIPLEENDLFEVDRNLNETKKFVGQKEVPNIRINCMQYDDNWHLHVSHSYFISTVQGYYEEYDSKNYYRITIATPVISLEDYEKLISCNHFSIDTEEIFRDTKNVDRKNCHHINGFNNINIKHKLYSDGEPTMWYITLSYNKPKIYTSEQINKNENKSNKPIKTKTHYLRKTTSENLSEVNL